MIELGGRFRLTATLLALATAALPPPASAQTDPWCPACSMLPTTIAFEPNRPDLPDLGKPILDSVAATLKSNGGARVELRAYASGLPDQAALARRVSLSRAIGVRAYLIEHGAHTTQIDVRAFGNRPDAGSPDRVDIVALER